MKPLKCCRVHFLTVNRAALAIVRCAGTPGWHACLACVDRAVTGRESDDERAQRLERTRSTARARASRIAEARRELRGINQARRCGIGGAP